MIKETFGAVGHAARGLFRGWGGLALLHVLYALLLASSYWFFAVGEANFAQLALTAVTFLLAPLLFFALQAAAAHFALGEGRAGALAARALRDSWKVLVVSLPLAALGVGLVYLLGKLPASGDAARAAATFGVPGVAPRPLHWQDALASTLWLLALGFALPLVGAHLWLSVARDGLKATLRRFHRVAGRAFLPRSVLAYGLGLCFFGLMPYFIIYTRPPIESTWAELLLFGLRLALAFVFTLWGWAVTLGALAALTNTTATPPPAETATTPAAEAETPHGPAGTAPQPQT